jgi:epoxyqueuosine reductase
MRLEEDILAEARTLGFSAAGFARLGPAQSIETFECWANSLRSAEMAYLRRNLQMRADPRNLAPGAISVIVVAARYPVNRRPGEGFSTYARGLDYHGVLRGKLRRLEQFIRARAALSVARVCVDSAPLLEREWAVRAGIGWLGRQGQIVNPKLGCCLVLGELLVDLALQPASPMPDRCGTCRRCVDACPTGAVGEDRLLDARRCISCLTVEHHGEIPPDLRNAQGAALFGCDSCTAVCPWNRHGNDKVMPELDQREMPGPGEILAMTPEQFDARFRDTAVYRTGLEQLRQNAAAALENRPTSGDPAGDSWTPL